MYTEPTNIPGIGKEIKDMTKAEFEQFVRAQLLNAKSTSNNVTTLEDVVSTSMITGMGIGVTISIFFYIFLIK